MFFVVGHVVARSASARNPAEQSQHKHAIGVDQEVGIKRRLRQARAPAQPWKIEHHPELQEPEQRLT